MSRGRESIVQVGVPAVCREGEMWEGGGWSASACSCCCKCYCLNQHPTAALPQSAAQPQRPHKPSLTRDTCPSGWRRSRTAWQRWPHRAWACPQTCGWQAEKMQGRLSQAMFGRPRQASSSPQKLHTTALLESAPKGSPTHYSLRHLAPPVEVAEGGDAAGRVGGQVGPAGGEILGEEEIVGARGAAAVEQKAEESRGKGVACVGRELINQ